MTTSWFEVRHQGLKAAQDGAVTVGGQVGQAAKRLQDATPKAVSHHSGWESSAALQQCLTAWETRLHALTSEVRQIGSNLGATSEAYKEAERKAVAMIEQVAKQLHPERG